MSDARRRRAVSASARPTSSTSAARSRGRESGRSYEVTDAHGRVPRQRALGVPQGRARRGRRRAGRVRAAGRARPRTTAGRSSTASPRCSRAGERSSSTRCARADGLQQRTARGRRRRGDRPLGLVRRAGPTRSPRCSAALEPGRRAVLQLLGARADRRGRGARAAGARRCSGSSRSSRRSIVTGNTCVVVASGDAAAAGDHARRGARDLRRARRRGQPAHRPVRRARALAGRAHGRQRDRPHRRSPTRARVPTSSVAAADNLKRVLRPRAEPSRTGPPIPASPDARVPRDEDRLAPDRGLIT